MGKNLEAVKTWIVNHWPYIAVTVLITLVVLIVK